MHLRVRRKLINPVAQTQYTRSHPIRVPTHYYYMRQLQISGFELHDTQ